MELDYFIYFEENNESYQRGCKQMNSLATLCRFLCWKTGNVSKKSCFTFFLAELEEKEMFSHCSKTVFSIKVTSLQHPESITFGTVMY